jgi:aconitate hydratase 2 / 2-methylisocitrate dehydratase
MLEDYLNHKTDREKNGLPALPLNSKQTADLVELLKNDNAVNVDFLIDLLTEHVPAGVDQAAFVKAAFLTDIANNKTLIPYITPEKSIELLGTMLGGYNVQSLVALLSTDQAENAVKALSKTTLIFDAFYDIQKLYENGNPYAASLLGAWANAEWFSV